MHEVMTLIITIFFLVNLFESFVPSFLCFRFIPLPIPKHCRRDWISIGFGINHGVELENGQA